MFYTSKLFFCQVAEIPVARKVAEDFVEFDPYGFAMAIIAMTVVFSALIVLYLTFRYIAKFYSSAIKFRLKKGMAEKIGDRKDRDEISGEVVAAISAAINIYRAQLHDMESFRLTIQRVSKAYSPWSSKLYGLRQTPNRIFFPKTKK